MSIVRIDASRLAQVEQFWQRSRHLYQNVGHEDLRTMLDQQIALFGEEGGRAWGFLCIQSERRPNTLPAAAPQRAYIRAVAVAAGYRPDVVVPELIDAAALLLPEYAPSHLLTIYGDQAWLNQALSAADFQVQEEIQFWQLSHVRRWEPSADLQTRVQRSTQAQPTLTLRPAHAADLATVAHLDAKTFTPLWHFGVAGLQELLFSSRFQLATIHDTPVGYSVITYHGTTAHLARLAVHPQWQAQGIGHVLLFDVLQDARAERVNSIMLNTQIDNERAQRLYHRYGFRPTPQVVPILGKTFGAL